MTDKAKKHLEDYRTMILDGKRGVPDEEEQQAVQDLVAILRRETPVLSKEQRNRALDRHFSRPSLTEDEWLELESEVHQFIEREGITAEELGDFALDAGETLAMICNNIRIRKAEQS